jgi:hypothetical protein
MAFNEQEKQIILDAANKGQDRNTALQRVMNFRMGIKKPQPAAEEPSQIAQAASEGLSKMSSGVSDIATGNPLKAIQGVFKVGAGAINTATSPLAPITNPIGNAINTAVVEPLSNTAPIRALANNTEQDGALDQTLSTLGDMGNVAGTVVSAPQVLKGVKATANGAAKVAPVIKNATQSVRSSATNMATGQVKTKLDEIFTSTTATREAIKESKSRGYDTTTFISQDSRFHPVVENNRVFSGEAITAIQTEAAPLAQIVRSVIEKEGVRVTPDLLYKEGLSQLAKYKNNGAVYDNYLAKLKKEVDYYRTNFTDANGTIDLAKYDDFKIAKWNQTYGVDADGAASKLVDVELGRALRSLVSKNVKSADANALNKELGRYYDAADALQLLDGQIVKGGRLGGYFARTIGATIGGASGGSFGAALGALTADQIANLMRANYFGNPAIKALVGKVKKDRPAIFSEAEAMLQKSPQALPSPGQSIQR